jgi:hypothetical protein
MTYLVEMTEAEYADVNRLKVSQMRMILHRAKPAPEMTHLDNLAYNIDNVIIAVNEKHARAHLVLQEQPARPDSIALFEPLQGKGAI